MTLRYRAYWIFIAGQAAGAPDDDARHVLESYVRADDNEVFRRIAHRHLNAGLKPWGVAISAESRKTIAAIEKTIWKRGRAWRMRIFLCLTFVLLLVWLANSFPGQIADENRPYLVVGGALAAAGLIFGRRIKLGEGLRNIAIWGAIAVVFLLGFTFQDELRNLSLRLRSELIPAVPVETGDHVMVLTAGQYSNFFVFGKANGTPVKFLIDTGASDVVLSPNDARRLGIDLDGLQFTHVVETANGLGSTASYRLRSLSIGPITLSNVGILINKSEVGQSLLGMTFLRDLASVEIRGRQLFLRWNSVP